MIEKENATKENKKDNLWCNYELPLEHRVPNSFLFALKRQFVAWKWDEGYFKVDPDLGLMKAGGKDILKAKVINDVLVLDWVDGSWEEWSDLTSSKEFLKLREEASTKLANKKAQTHKGAGKGFH